MNATRPLSQGNNKCLFLIVGYNDLVRNSPNSLRELLKKMILFPYVLAFII